MKDFIKWLGVNEKVAKLAIWLLIFMITLIIINSCLESIGMPYYKVTIENLSKIKTNSLINYLCNLILSITNFTLTILLAVRTRRIKELIPYILIYAVISTIVVGYTGYGVTQILIFAFTMYTIIKFSEKPIKGIYKGLIAIVINTIVQYICCYAFKFKYMEITKIEGLNYLLTSLDSFLILLVMIIVKELYLYKRERSERNDT